MKSVLTAFPNRLVSAWASSVLQRGGYAIEYTLKTAGELIRIADFCTSPVAVCAVQFIDMDARTLAGIIEGKLEPVFVALPHQLEETAALSYPVISYPSTAQELLSAVARVENKAANSALGLCLHSGKGLSSDRSAEEKLLVLKAKEMIQEKTGLTESQAHRYLQKVSMDHCMKLVEAAALCIDGLLPLPD